MKIVLGVSGSIAAYKTIDLARKLQVANYDIEIVLSRMARKLLPEISLQTFFPNKVHFYNDTMNKNQKMLHIELAKAADLVLIGPATANIIAKLAHGFGDCLLSNICLATESPIAVAPAMNHVMFANRFVQRNIEILKEHGVKIIDPICGEQACGDVGIGNMANIEEILNVCDQILEVNRIFCGKKIVITAGATREMIDPLRFISNSSSGKMGRAIAKSAITMGAKEVVLISANTSIQNHIHVRCVSVQTADEMFLAAQHEAMDADIFIGCAAVADYKPSKYLSTKMKKQIDGSDITLEMTETIDVIASIKNLYPKLFCIGFAAETDDKMENGLRKLKKKNLDMIAINDVSEGRAIGKDSNELDILTKNGDHYHLSEKDKSSIAADLLQIVGKCLKP